MMSDTEYFVYRAINEKKYVKPSLFAHDLCHWLRKIELSVRKPTFINETPSSFYSYFLIFYVHFNVRAGHRTINKQAVWTGNHTLYILESAALLVSWHGAAAHHLGHVHRIRIPVCLAGSLKKHAYIQLMIQPPLLLVLNTTSISKYLSPLTFNHKVDHLSYYL